MDYMEIIVNEDVIMIIMWRALCIAVSILIYIYIW